MKGQRLRGRKKELDDAARKGTVYALGVSGVYTTATAARHVALVVVRWRARALESTDKAIKPEDIGFVTA
jgi:hypothetical protein